MTSHRQTILKRLKQMEQMFSTSELFDIVQFVENARDNGRIYYKDLSASVKEYLKKLRRALANIRLKPGDGYPPGHPSGYESLTREEQHIIYKASRIIKKITIKEDENVDPVPIH